MPMFKALAALPRGGRDPPGHGEVSRPWAAQVRRTMMLALTPLVEPLSIDEAFLDLTGTERLHRGCPAPQPRPRWPGGSRRELGITVSIGLSYNKFLAKLASDLDKPRGFAVIGRAEAAGFLADKPVGLIWGVGRRCSGGWPRDGICEIGQLQRGRERELVAALWQHRAAPGPLRARRGRPPGRSRRAGSKSISAETTFDSDLSDAGALARYPVAAVRAGRRQAARRASSPPAP